ncbi:MAG: Rrf2 family transcriptional regulator [Candidatus Omnitrophica bacterium]|nr:Rrf2 family transcriptional regulator [Candidatus Omnitrophota bacterium]MDD5661783.1 Rrf2 family transcriptional regulator [Candidatus Omnitrophota bacterium]
MKLITRSTDYALRALCFIAKYKGKIVSVSELALKLRVPQPFLRKILQALNGKGILTSLKGQGGGFTLAKEPAKIFITDIMRIFQGTLRLNECFLQKLACPHKKTCLLRKKITGIERYVLRELNSITLESLLE